MRVKVKCELNQGGYRRTWYVDGALVNINDFYLYGSFYEVCKVQTSEGYGIMETESDVFLSHDQKKKIKWEPFPEHATASEVMDALVARIVLVREWTDTLQTVTTECEREF